MTAYPPITVRQPQLYDIVDDPIVVCGVGAGVEATIGARARDAQGRALGEVTITAGGPGLWGNFQTIVPIGRVPASPHGTLEVFERSAHDGAERNRVTLVVTFGRALIDPYHGFVQHIVRAGETLAAIAARYYGRANLWSRLFEANRHVLLDSDRILTGQVLRVPR